MFTPTKVKEEAIGLSERKAEKARKGLRNKFYVPIHACLPEKCFLCRRIA